jgi:hypothetical protein
MRDSSLLRGIPFAQDRVRQRLFIRVSLPFRTMRDSSLLSGIPFVQDEMRKRFFYAAFLSFRSVIMRSILNEGDMEMKGR